MAHIIVSLHPKEVATLKAEMDDVSYPVITLHSITSLELREDKKPPEVEKQKRFVLMRTALESDVLLSISNGLGYFVDFVSSVNDAISYVRDNYEGLITHPGFREPVTERVYFFNTHRGVQETFFLIPIE